MCFKGRYIMAALYSRCLSVLILCKLTTLIMAFEDLTIDLSEHDCDTRYNLDEYNSVYFEFHGSTRILTSNPCHVEFVKSSNKREICISTQEVSLDCQTELEYHEYFVKNYLEPEKKVTCYDTYVEEWCPSQYEDTIFVVIRKPETVSSDNIQLRIYLKDVPQSSYVGTSSTIWIAVIGPAAVAVVVIVLIVIKVRRTAASQSQQVVYQTTTGNVGMQTGTCYPASRQTHQGYHPVQQHAPPQFQGNYNVHPMQTAYPVTQPQNSINAASYPQQYPPAPPMSSYSAPPPTYDSLLQK